MQLEIDSVKVSLPYCWNNCWSGGGGPSVVLLMATLLVAPGIGGRLLTLLTIWDCTIMLLDLLIMFWLEAALLADWPFLVGLVSGPRASVFSSLRYLSIFSVLSTIPSR
jgi:hypothetical protein